MQNQKTNLSGQGKSFPLFKSLSSVLRYGTEKSSGNDELDLHKQKPTVHKGFQHWKYCILYFSSKTLSYLHKRLPGKQRKADDVMEGEMIMSSCRKWNPADDNNTLTQICRAFWMAFQIPHPPAL